MFELNQAERRALRTVAALLVLAAGVRAWATPPASDLAWRATESGGPADPGAVRDAVSDALEREARAATPLAAGERVDPNRAAEEELRRLPGVGPALARAIAEERARAPFARAEDLERVPGIGPATVRRLAPHLALDGTGRGSPPSALRPGGAAGRVDVNRADTLALRGLPGIGPARARALVETRERLGGFRSVEDLLKVPGIGPATLERLRPLVALR